MKYLKLYESEIDLSYDESVDDVLIDIEKELIRTGLRPYISHENNKIYIQFILNDKENMASFMNIMNVLNKLKSDKLIQYQCDFSLSETQDDKSLITAVFHIDDNF